jgi:hypothetical protein
MHYLFDFETMSTWGYMCLIYMDFAIRLYACTYSILLMYPEYFTEIPRPILTKLTRIATVFFLALSLDCIWHFNPTSSGLVWRSLIIGTITYSKYGKLRQLVALIIIGFLICPHLVPLMLVIFYARDRENNQPLYHEACFTFVLYSLFELITSQMTNHAVVNGLCMLTMCHAIHCFIIDLALQQSQIGMVVARWCYTPYLVKSSPHGDIV